MKKVMVLALLAVVALSAKEVTRVNEPAGRTGGFMGDTRSMRLETPPPNAVQGNAGRIENAPVESPIDWGGVVTVDTGAFVDYACDYNSADGTMWVLTSRPDSVARLYRSTDHGASWQFVFWMTTSPNDVFRKVGLVVGEGDSSFLYVFLRHRFNDGDIYLYRIAPDLSTWAFLPVFAGADTVNHFTACRDFHNGYYLYVATSNQQTTGINGKFVRSRDYGVTWSSSMLGNVWDPTIRAGADNSIGLAWTWPGRTGVWAALNNDRGEPSAWQISRSVGFDTFQTCFPTLAFANTEPDTEATMWVAYSYNWDNSGDWDIWAAVRSHAWGDTWHKMFAVSVWSDSSEYGPDIENFKGAGNPYVNVAYNVFNSATPSTSTHWAWSISSGPDVWNEKTAVSSPGSPVGPYWQMQKVIYSPGAPASGGGVLFTYSGISSPWGLFFAAPWITTGAADRGTAKALAAGLRVTPTLTQSVARITAPKGTKVLTIHDAAGRLVSRFEGPSETLVWKTDDLDGHPVSAGIYIVRAEMAQGSIATKVVVNR
jgi:hypothetical protein